MRVLLPILTAPQFAKAIAPDDVVAEWNENRGRWELPKEQQIIIEFVEIEIEGKSD